MFNESYQFILEQIGKNDLIAGGAVLGALAFILNYAKRVPFIVIAWSRLAFATNVDIPDRTNAFIWIRDWLAENNYSKKSKRITIENTNNSNKKSTITPAPGRHLIWWNKTPLLIRRIRREGTGDNAHRAFKESWAITMLGKRSKIELFIEECRKCSRGDKDDYISVKQADGEYWGQGLKRKRRNINSVILPEDMKDILLKDLNEFIDSKDWYASMSIPWRRGYLLTGPPGNGKSSIISAIASEINFGIYIINLKTIEEDNLVSLLAETGKESIVLLEDIDRVFDDREDKKGISLSTLLNCLDGVNATEGRILFMTTNHPEKLDPALVRPGRIDLSLTLSNATRYQINELYKRFYEIEPSNNDFAICVEKMDISMAKLQGHFLNHRFSSEDAIKNIGELTDA